ncbi:helix-turn-helix transcriptional regulator [Planktotalea sp.]|uniref:helix-turn-helix transcriptional regulator n=1 Tax=Planktotalea sp. TaxID=2029877 RepID=UPI0032973607
MAELHNNLKSLRTEKGFTQASLADAVGVTRKTINTIENRVFTPSTLLAMQIAQTLDLTVHDIFYVKDD